MDRKRDFQLIPLPPLPERPGAVRRIGDEPVYETNMLPFDDSEGRPVHLIRVDACGVGRAEWSCSPQLARLLRGIWTVDSALAVLADLEAEA